MRIGELLRRERDDLFLRVALPKGELEHAMQRNAKERRLFPRELLEVGVEQSQDALMRV